jgi:hypothetical protein
VFLDAATLALVWCDLGREGSTDDNLGGGAAGQDVTSAQGTTSLDDDVTGTCGALACP